VSHKGRVIVWGQMFRAPFGGMIWQVLHYLLALRELGFDVWYVEDSDEYLFDPDSYQPVWDVRRNVEVGLRYLSRFGFAERWAVRTPNRYDECFGVESYAELLNLYRSADAVINLCGSQELRDDHGVCKTLVYLETDPVRNQVAVAKGQSDLIAELDRYAYLFTYGVNIGHQRCEVPLERYRWLSTVPPVITELWRSDQTPASRAFTTIANWKHAGKDVEWQGRLWRWSKHFEFTKFIRLPGLVDTELELAIGAVDEDSRKALKDHGWKMRTSAGLADPFEYRSFIQASLAEFTAAKEQYVAPRSGWFSDRSVCYLAAGRPVVTQSTGFEDHVPTGQGLFAFQTVEDAASAVCAIARDYPAHSAAAAAIAREHFEGVAVVRKMLYDMEML
jgi:hypothetical protein